VPFKTLNENIVYKLIKFRFSSGISPLLPQRCGSTKQMRIARVAPSVDGVQVKVFRIRIGLRETACNQVVEQASKSPRLKPSRWAAASRGTSLGSTCARVTLIIVIFHHHPAGTIPATASAFVQTIRMMGEITSGKTRPKISNFWSGGVCLCRNAFDAHPIFVAG
jgi:hypothetical protein